MGHPAKGSIVCCLWLFTIHRHKSRGSEVREYGSPVISNEDIVLLENVIGLALQPGENTYSFEIGMDYPSVMEVLDASRNLDRLFVRYSIQSLLQTNMLELTIYLKFRSEFAARYSLSVPLSIQSATNAGKSFANAKLSNESTFGWSTSFHTCSSRKRDCRSRLTMSSHDPQSWPTIHIPWSEDAKHQGAWYARKGHLQALIRALLYGKQTQLLISDLP